MWNDTSHVGGVLGTVPYDWTPVTVAAGVGVLCAVLLIPWTWLGHRIDAKTLAEFDG